MFIAGIVSTVALADPPAWRTTRKSDRPTWAITSNSAPRNTAAVRKLGLSPAVFSHAGPLRVKDESLGGALPCLRFYQLLQKRNLYHYISMREKDCYAFVKKRKHGRTPLVGITRLMLNVKKFKRESSPTYNSWVFGVDSLMNFLIAKKKKMLKSS